MRPENAARGFCGAQQAQRRYHHPQCLAEIAEWPNEIDKARAEAAKARAEERLANRTEAIDVKRAEFALRKALVRIDIAR